MVASAAGMAANGRTVVACTYGVFLSMRALESIRSFICYPNLNVKFLSSHGGLTAAIDGVTHQATEDVAFLSTLPNMKVLCPADPVAAGKDITIVSHGATVFQALFAAEVIGKYGMSDRCIFEASVKLLENKRDT